MRAKFYLPVPLWAGLPILIQEGSFFVDFLFWFVSRRTSRHRPPFLQFVITRTWTSAAGRVSFSPSVYPLISIPLQHISMQRSAILSLLIPLIFGIPFLLLLDLFPFHRYGMFARIPASKPAPEVRIMLASQDSLLELKTGSPCLDRGMLAQMAAQGFENQSRAAELLVKLRPSLRPFPDSIFLEQNQPAGWLRKRIFP
jgi:hypothetical protein